VGVPADRCVMLRPFKILAFEQQLRDYLKILERKLLSDNEENLDKTSFRSEVTNALDISDDGDHAREIVAKDTVDHLRCFIDFIDHELREDLEIHRGLRDGTAKMVAFKDLWHLYGPGDIVIEDGVEF